jgi:hypothetical protein
MPVEIQQSAIINQKAAANRAVGEISSSCGFWSYFLGIFSSRASAVSSTNEPGAPMY